MDICPTTARAVSLAPPTNKIQKLAYIIGTVRGTGALKKKDNTVKNAVESTTPATIAHTACVFM